MPRLRFVFFIAFWFTPLARAEPALASTPPARVLLYSEPDYRGECLIVEAGAELENLEFINDSRGRRWNDRIMSVALEGAVLLTAYENSRYRGAQVQLARGSPDLSAISFGQNPKLNWARAISSLRATPLVAGVRTFVEWSRRDADAAIRSAYRDLFGRDPDTIGLNNYRKRLLDSGWTETQLRDDIRKSTEYKNRDLNAIARNAYREILGRDPDASGLAAYTRSLGRGMSDSELRAELRRSPEGVTRAARETVTRLYREILRREPDPDGLANYTKMLVERGWDEARLREALRRSPEFKK